jgi:hypothetical protein
MVSTLVIVRAVFRKSCWVRMVKSSAPTRRAVAGAQDLGHFLDCLRHFLGADSLDHQQVYPVRVAADQA